MLISTKGRYALRVLTDLAEHQTGEYLPLKEVADRQDISEKYLESIMKALVRGGIVSGLRGKGGGYRLSRPADQICVGSVLELMEGSLAPVSCLESEQVPCPRMARCRTLNFWHGLNDTIRQYIYRYTLADLAKPDEPGDNYVI